MFEEHYKKMEKTLDKIRKSRNPAEVYAEQVNNRVNDVLVPEKREIITTDIMSLLNQTYTPSEKVSICTKYRTK
jgi:hypothetical protein